MGDQTKETTTTDQQAEKSVPQAPPQTDHIIDEPGDGDEGAKQLGSLFGESVTDAQLKGEEEPPKAEETAPSSKEPAADESKAEKGKQDEEKADTNKDEKAEEKPPAGYVPQQALHEARQKAKAAAERAAQLEAEIQSLRAGKDDDLPESVDDVSVDGIKEGIDAKGEKFELMSEDDLDELWDVDPRAARKYERREAEFKAQVKRERLAKQQGEQNVQRAYARLEKELPDLMAENSTLRDDLVEYAETQGIASNALAVLTNPGTVIVVKDARGRNVSMPLGDIAVDITKIIHDSFVNSPDKLRTKLKSEIEAEVKKDLARKLKTNQTAELFTSLGDLPTQEDAAESDVSASIGGVLSESEYATATDAKRRAWLGG